LDVDRQGQNRISEKFGVLVETGYEGLEDRRCGFFLVSLKGERKGRKI